MKFVYVLVSNTCDLYYEQFFLSVTSLRLFNPEADIVVLVDKKTKNELTGMRTGYETVVSETQVISVPETLSKKEISRWIKTAIRQYVSGDFLYIDCDTIIADTLDCSSLLNSNIKIGAVLDTHVPLSKHHLTKEFQSKDTLVGFESSLKTDTHYNSGVLFCRDTPETHLFFDRWHLLWIESNKKNIPADQPALNQANFELNGVITEIGGEWNCQISHNGLPFLHTAKIIHYFATSLVSFNPAFLLADTAILQRIQTTGVIDANTTQLLHTPKAAFQQKSRIVSDDIALAVFDSNIFSKLVWLRRKNQGLFNGINALFLHFKRKV